MPTLRSHSHLQATQIQAQTKAYKRVCLPQHTDGRKNNEGTTMYIKNCCDCSEIRHYSPLQLSCSLTGMKPAVGYYSYTKRWHLM